MTHLHVTGIGAGRYKVELDGHDIAHGLRSLSIDLDGERPPQVTAELNVFEVRELALDDVRVSIPDATRELLVRLGWTPPSDPASATRPDETASPALTSPEE